MATARPIVLATLVTLAMLTTLLPSALASDPARAETFTLANGMQVVVVPDHRAPVVTHMVWYRVGGADEPRGTSGIAHFLEHLMFKSTDTIASGEFSKIISRIGGQDNAFTSQDATAYFQRISKDRLATVMKMEADRMVNLRLTPEEVATERDVILEERRSRVENEPSSILDEQMNAQLYLSHPYGTPVIGWMHEMAKLSREDALDFYKLHYAPNNAILVVAGDVTAAEVGALAADTYAKIPANPAITARARVVEPDPRAPRRVTYEDPRAGKPMVRRYYFAPSYVNDEPGEAEALDLLMKIVASGATSRLYRALVVEQRVASSAGGWYSSSGLDSGKIALSAVPADGKTLDDVEAAIDAVIEDVKANGVTAAELERAKRVYIADYIYESDNQSTMARRYGWGMIVGQSVAEIEDWPKELEKVTPEAVTAAAAKYLDLRRSVTGRLVPSPERPAAAKAPAGQPNRS